MQHPVIQFSTDLSDTDSAASKEWLVTNGLGGYGSSTILGINNRKYHALFVAALRPPGERTIILSKLDEDIESDGKVLYRLGTNHFQQTTYPTGYRYLEEFNASPFPTQKYRAGEYELTKLSFLLYGKNSSITLYSATNPTETNITVNVYPLLTFRLCDYVIDNKTNPPHFNQQEENSTVHLEFENPKAVVSLRAIGGSFSNQPTWVDGIYYPEEHHRGESYFDGGYQPGALKFSVEAKSQAKFAVCTVAAETSRQSILSLNELGETVANIEVQLKNELAKRSLIIENFYNAHKEVPVNSGLSLLLQAANDFVVKKRGNGHSVIAGYHWFSSWGRDSFISLPGLMLVTGRFREAKEVILDYTGYCKRGLVPNFIHDVTGQPLYNTVDGTLWYINSILQYLKYTNDFNFVKYLWPTLIDIYENFKQGTLNGIKAAPDGLLAHDAQLTWMDAVVDGVPVTPRAGKAVEVQALWYNALRTIELIAKHFNEEKVRDDLASMAELAKENFLTAFWDSKQNCLFDCIDQNNEPDRSVRPNQVIAGALDFRLLDKQKTGTMVDFVQSELWTPVGLRTLSPKDSRYRGKYEGSRSDRDQAYHSGTIWPWLTGPLTTAYVNANGTSRDTLQYAFNTFISRILTNEVYRGGLGTVNEILNGDSPYSPHGCIAQAWSVAEPLRAYIEDVLQIKPKYGREIVNLAPEILTA
jgi:predicted glycogen debranching enzyme